MASEKQRQKIVEAFAKLAADRDFAAIGLDEIAGEVGLTLAQLRAAYDGKMAILEDFARRIDQEVLAGQDDGMAGEPPGDRLFDVLMRRLDVLTPHKAAVAGLLRSARRDPGFAAAMNGIAIRSQRWMLTAAGLDRGGLMGLARAQALAIAWAQILPVWLEEEDPALPKTMAALDKSLKRLGEWGRRAERLEGFLCRLGGRVRRTAPPPAARSEAVDAGAV